jgi:predicted PurR-regulated permease PerM
VAFLDRLQPGTREAVRAAGILLAATAFAVLAALIAWKLAHVLLLGFGAILVAILLRTLADLFERYTTARGRWSLALAGVTVLAVIAGFVLVLGAQLRRQASDLIGRFPEILSSVEQRLGLSNLDQWIAERAEGALSESGVVAQVAGYTSVMAGAAANIIVVLVVGIYLASRPDLYRTGLLKLFPRKRRRETDETLTAIARALRLWLLGQLAAMALVGCLTGVGLWLLGVPSALALGFLAGMAEFIPFVGPILSAVPAVLVALSQDATMALWVVGLYLLVQQIEGNVITPLVQQHAVDLPPAITLLAILAFGVLFGSLGVILATPLAVVVLVAIKKLWVRDTLEESTDLPGEGREAQT